MATMVEFIKRHFTSPYYTYEDWLEEVDHYEYLDDGLDEFIYDEQGKRVITRVVRHKDIVAEELLGEKVAILCDHIECRCPWGGRPDPVSIINQEQKMDEEDERYELLRNNPPVTLADLFNE